MAVSYRETTLDNGLRLVAEVNPDAHTTAIGFFVKTGTRDEDKSLMGVSHFLEHMMFKGTERRSADDVNREFDEIGASHNAFTTNEMTAFYAHVLPEHLPQAADILADILRPSLRDSDFSDEKGVILEEIAMYRDQPFWVLYEDAMERYYGEHPLSYRILGTDDTIKSMSSAQMREYFQQRYSADNTTVALAGNLDFERMVEEVRQRCGGWQRTGAARPAPAPARHEGAHTIHDPRLNRAYILALAPAPAANDERRYAATLLARLLGETDGSRLYWALVDTGLAEAAEAHYEPRDGTGDHLVFAATAPQSAEKVWSIMEREIDGLVEKIEESDLERLKNKVLTAVTLQSERPAGRMQRLGRWFMYFDEYASLEDELKKIDAITIEDLRAVYEAYPFQPRTVVTLLPQS
jgi:predicted Zn-dependent peptidase